MLKNLFGLCAGENIRNLVLEAEEMVPPYPNIPHFFVLQRKRKRDYYQQDTYKLFELVVLYEHFQYYTEYYLPDVVLFSVLLWLLMRTFMPLSMASTLAITMSSWAPIAVAILSPFLSLTMTSTKAFVPPVMALT
jgi:hypothetical protein